MTALIEIEGLRIGIEGAHSSRPVVENVNLTVAAGEVVALVGESGAGKSLTALSLVRLLPTAAAVTAGAIRFRGEDVLGMTEARLNKLRGGEVAMLFQHPRAALDPTARVGAQIAEALRWHRGLDRRAAWARAVALLREVGISDPEMRAEGFAHQMSGGMAQRIMIAAALSAGPALLIADEPTTALDVTVQGQILILLDALRRERGLAILLVSHDLGVVAAIAERILVMYAGRIVEEGPTKALLADPQHPYTQSLVQSSRLRPSANVGLECRPPIVGRPDAGMGCRFLSRCGVAHRHGLGAQCGESEPELLPLPQARKVRCWGVPAPSAGAREP
jgi:peptide/nickel transport system ATP-binding protein